jgi:hypothetical protein
MLIERERERECSDPPTVPNAVFSLELAETVIFKYNCSGGLNLIGDNAIHSNPTESIKYTRAYSMLAIYASNSEW